MGAKDREPRLSRYRGLSVVVLYYSNKDADTLNGLRWIQKGGGYYSICNARLKQDS